ncbi:MAG: nicotinate-nucleotide adenylyltransferase, partial [Deinococcota bacterium]
SYSSNLCFGFVFVKLGVFGGRFDPPHLGHLLVALQAIEQLRLDQLWFVPAASPPHKPTVASAEARYAMLLLATAGHTQSYVSRIELERNRLTLDKLEQSPSPPELDSSKQNLHDGGLSYSIDTVESICSAYPSSEVFFVGGSDAIASIESWHRAEDLIRLVRLVAIPRAGYSLTNLNPAIRDNVHVLNTLQCDISSTLIRTRIQHHQSIHYLVPDLVEDYLVKHAIYS